MFKLFNAALGVALAVWLFSPQIFLAWIETPPVQKLRAQMVAEHPRQKLAMQLSWMIEASR